MGNISILPKNIFDPMGSRCVAFAHLFADELFLVCLECSLNDLEGLVNFWYLLSLGGSLLGGVVLLFTAMGSAMGGSAPQTAAGAALAAALAVVPYVLARSIQIAAADRRHQKHEERVRELLERISDAAQAKDK